MASINTIVKRKQYLWLGIVVVGTASAIGGALYLSDVDMSGNGETVAEQEPVPDMTGVVDTTFDDKVRQHATTEMQVTAAQMQKQYEEIRRELDVLNKQRGDDQRRIEKLGQDNAALAEQVKALGANPVTATGEPVPQMPASPPGPEGEPQPGNTPVSFPPQGSVAVPPPTAFYPGKLNVIDEGWRLLDFKNHKVGEFIEKGYRTARRHTGAYITITQNIVDFDSDKASSAARAAWGNSSYKIILKQSAKEFAKYNQLYPDQFLPLQRDMIGKFGAAKDQWFSSFLLQVENHSSWHRLFVDPLSRAMYSSDGPDFEFVQQKRKEGL
ncbi:TPA: conjugal transfer protein TraC, partial [Escherichia coli]|nr:conjugal transfer protein TraC [Escherichia coli]